MGDWSTWKVFGFPEISHAAFELLGFPVAVLGNSHIWQALRHLR